MIATQRLVGQQPPQRIVEAGLKAAGVPDPDRVEPATNAGAVVAHLGYGAMLGALLALEGWLAARARQAVVAELRDGLLEGLGAHQAGGLAPVPAA
jgi:hypothetical protein